jgi:hypothetical protein
MGRSIRRRSIARFVLQAIVIATITEVSCTRSYKPVTGLVVAVIMTAIVLFSRFAMRLLKSKSTNESEGSSPRYFIQTVRNGLADRLYERQFIACHDDMCQSTKMLSAFVISTSSGFVFAWPDQTNSIQYDARAKARITATLILFSKSFSADIDGGVCEAADAIVIRQSFGFCPQRRLL